MRIDIDNVNGVVPNSTEHSIQIRQYTAISRYHAVDWLEPMCPVTNKSKTILCDELDIIDGKDQLHLLNSIGHRGR